MSIPIYEGIQRVLSDATVEMNDDDIYIHMKQHAIHINLNFDIDHYVIVRVSTDDDLIRTDTYITILKIVEDMIEVLSMLIPALDSKVLPNYINRVKFENTDLMEIWT